MIEDLQTYISKANPGRYYKFGTVATFSEVPAVLKAMSPHFVLLLTMDATTLDDHTLRTIARTVLSQGLAYLCVWGPDCSRVHDQFDLERDPNETDGRVVVTTWHDDEPLSEAVWYFVHNAYPSDDFEESCKDWVALSIENEQWTEEFRRSLAEIDSNSMVL